MLLHHTQPIQLNPPLTTFLPSHESWSFSTRIQHLFVDLRRETPLPTRRFSLRRGDKEIVQQSQLLTRLASNSLKTIPTAVIILTLANRPNMSERKVAISTHPDVTLPPRLSDGKILPKAVWNFERHCRNYFLNAEEVPDDAKVSRLLSSFEDCLVNDWMTVNRDRLTAITFEQFMTEFRTRWLPRHWESQMRMQLLRSRFDPKKVDFETWVYQVQVLNVYLRGTPSHLDDDSMRLQIRDSIDGELQSLVRKKKNLNEITELHLWIAEVKSLDDQRREEEKRIQEVFDQVMSARNRQFDASSRNARIK